MKKNKYSKKVRKHHRRQPHAAQPTAGEATRTVPGASTLRPLEFMRARRPHLFSDTTSTEGPQVDRRQLEYQLETLTNRKEEVVFEHFARKLAEKELCPNLLPQTGPTGGTAKSTPKPILSQKKSHSAGTTRKPAMQEHASGGPSRSAPRRTGNPKYAQIFKDKDRAALEDELRDAYAIDVRILDRTWIRG